MNKEQQVYDKLSLVYDPELDQPLPELGFIDHIDIQEDLVEVIFRLPTYWCSPNFAYIMAEDIHKHVTELDWVKEVKVNLIDHCASDQINNGISSGRNFSESLTSFSGSDGELDELRKIFQIKAFYARQEKLVRHLLYTEEWSKEQIISLTLDELEKLPLSSEGRNAREKYLEKKALFDHQNSLAITTPEGEPLTLEAFSDYLLGAKRTRMSMEFNGAYCRGLLEARYKLNQGSQAVPANK